jgi:hypothetical protein
VPHGNDHLAVKALRKPWAGKDREWILEQGTLSMHIADKEGMKIADHPQDVLAGTEGTQLSTQVVIVFQQLAESSQILGLIFHSNVGVPVMHRGTEDPWTMQNIQGLTNICYTIHGCKHLADPGRTGAMRTRDQNWAKLSGGRR